MIVPRLDCDLLELLCAVVEGRLADAEIRWKPQAAVCVVMAAKGYPGAYDIGKVIQGLDGAAALPDVSVFHAGTKMMEHLTLTAGGRVLGVTGLGTSIAAARTRVYEAVGQIHFDGAHFRRDIGAGK